MKKTIVNLSERGRREREEKSIQMSPRKYMLYDRRGSYRRIPPGDRGGEILEKPELQIKFFKLNAGPLDDLSS